LESGATDSGTSTMAREYPSSIATNAAAVQYREHLRSLIACAVNALPQVRFNKHDPQHSIAICLYGTILQSASDCYRLMQEPTVLVAGALRSILESYVDLVAIIGDRDHAKRMLATFHDEQRKHLEDMVRTPTNPFHVDVAQHIEPAEKLKEVEAELQSLREQGHQPLSVYDRFARAGLTDLYRTAYWQLCLHAHNNIVALERRHIRRVGEDFEIDVFSENSDDDIVLHCDTLGGILVQSTRKLYGLVDFQIMPAEFEKTIAAFEAVRPTH
jgi:hypothetical protein